MKKQIFSAVASLAVVAAMSVSAFAVTAGSTNGSAEGEIKDGKVTLDNSVTVEGDLPEGTVVTVVDEKATEEDTKAVADAVEATKSDLDVTSVNTVIDITAKDAEGVAVQPNEDGSVTVTVAYDGVSNAVLYLGEDKIEELELKVYDDKSFASFTTSHFSTFYMVTLNENGDDNGTGSDKPVNTGVVLAVVPAIAAAAAIVVSKKRK